jgi:chromosome segregation ATPase
MSPNTKQILAITLGSVGLVLGAAGMITAYNAKNAVNDQKNVTALVEQRFAEAQAKQDKSEKKQVSQAEKLINGLSSSEKNLVKKINNNSQAIKSLRNQVNSLSIREQELDNEVNKLSKQQVSDYNELNARIDSTNKQVKKLQNNVNSNGGASP